MAGDDHRRGSVSNNFCSVAGTPCKCPNNYIENCESQADGWGTYTQKYTTRNKVTKIIEELRQNRRSFEAHHMLPVACVTEVILEWDEKNNTDPSVITGTKWCINEEINMIALPMWGHTILHYTENFEALSQEVRDEIDSVAAAAIGATKLGKLSVAARRSLSNLVTVNTAPPFEKLPQHNYGHTGGSAATGYNEEIIDKLKKITMNIERAKDVHQTDKINSLKGALNDLSKDMEEELKDRGVRAYGGTHQAWKKGMEGKRDWYKSFSMASDPKKMTFPLGRASGGMAKKIADLAQSMFMSG